MALLWGWVEVEHNEKQKHLVFRRAGTRLTVVYSKMMVVTELDHPRLGSSQLVRKHLSREMIEEIFEYPRVHTQVGYIVKKHKHWNSKVRRANRKLRRTPMVRFQKV